MDKVIRLLRLALLLVPALLMAQSRHGSISGRIVTGMGEPVVGVRVAAMTSPAPGAQGAHVPSLVSIVRTDSAGRYRLEEVPSGSYLVVAGPLDAPT